MPSEFERMNSECTCITLSRDRLGRVLSEVIGDDAFCRDLDSSHANLVSAQPLFLDARHAATMMAIVRAIESCVESPAYRSAVAARSPGSAGYRPGPVGVFMGYDFHLSPDGPRLIEVNTNAGGALINAYVQAAQLICCGELALQPPGRPDLEALLARFVASFRSEWQHQRGSSTSPRSIAIVDDQPQRQYLYPEMVLFQRLVERHGISAEIADASVLAHRDGALWLGSRRIDLVYNRLTDFDLSEREHEALRSAYLAGDVVVSPNPWAHAHFADKRNLVLLSDPQQRHSLGLAPDVVASLADGIPRTTLVTEADAEALWSRRNQLFFKPCAGYGSKAAYRGDKLTRKVWSEILAGSYVAQEIVPPSARSIVIDGRVESLKADLRCYTYAGELLLLAARLYQGQTTNLRTPGGGFAPVLIGTGVADCRC